VKAIFPELIDPAVRHGGWLSWIRKRTVPSRSKASNLRATKQDEATFSEVVRLIAASHERAFQAVNTELIDHYWQVGATISRKIKAAEWAMGSYNDSLPYCETQLGSRGFTRPNLFRMRQFYETYQDDEKSYHWCDNCRVRIT
jgi:DUF1016 N-terminal domain